MTGTVHMVFQKRFIWRWNKTSEKMTPLHLPSGLFSLVPAAEDPESSLSGRGLELFPATKKNTITANTAQLTHWHIRTGIRFFIQWNYKEKYAMIKAKSKKGIDSIDWWFLWILPSPYPEKQLISIVRSITIRQVHASFWQTILISAFLLLHRTWINCLI